MSFKIGVSGLHHLLLLSAQKKRGADAFRDVVTGLRGVGVRFWASKISFVATFAVHRKIDFDVGSLYSSIGSQDMGNILKNQLQKPLFYILLHMFICINI
jgi:hypothetical protein